VPLLGAAPPSSLDEYETVVLPWPEWAVHDDLAPGAVRETLSSLGLAVEHVGRVSVSEPRRGHVVAVFHVELVDGSTRSVCVEGAGLGYLGRHALAVARPLAEFLPEVYGLRDGLLYREWFPEETRLKEPDPARIASYVVARNRALAVQEDTTLRLVGRDPAWELAADMLGRAFGRARLVVRPFAQRAARRLLETAQPSVVDGSMALSHWFSSAGGARKVGFHRRAFSNEDRSSYDPVYDLAGAANDEHDAALRAEYERLAGEPVAPERWLLYRLLHHRVDRREARAAGDVDRLLACERAMSRIHQRYVGEQLLADVTAPDSGALCAIDVDWVLEVRWLAMPAISPAAALALGALARHGYRPVVATGRSLGEVQDRCRAYRLAGGVAEYGAVVYDHRAGRVRSLLSAQDEADLAALRAVLLETPGVHVDRAHEHSVRAYRLDARGTSGLDAATIDDALARVPQRDRLRTIPADSQTDFVAAAVDKGRGVRALAAELREHRIALAVGDSASDLPMLAAAERAAAPANADAAVRAAGIELMSRPNGAGLLEAVSALLGHRPRHCATCAPAIAPSAGAATLLTVLGALDGGAREKARQAARLAMR